MCKGGNWLKVHIRCVAPRALPVWSFLVVVTH